MRKRTLLSIILSLVMIMTMIPMGMAVNAAETDGADEDAMPFADVKEGSWYYDPVKYVSEYGLMNGTSRNTFDPDGNLTRAMFVTILGRLANVDQDDYTGSSFKDVDTGQWYSAYIEWAASKNITNGINGGKFGTDSPVTREQIAVFIARFLDSESISLPDDTDTVERFKDADKVSDWAADGLELMRKCGMFKGDNNGNFNPANSASRAEAAALFSRLDKARDAVNEDESYGYTVTFEPNWPSHSDLSKSGTTKPVSAEADGTVKLSQNKYCCWYKKSGMTYEYDYKFTGWALTKNGAPIYADQAVIHPDSDMTLYATWDYDGDTVVFKKEPYAVPDLHYTGYAQEVLSPGQLYDTSTHKNVTTYYSMAGSTKGTTPMKLTEPGEIQITCCWERKNGVTVEIGKEYTCRVNLAIVRFDSYDGSSIEEQHLYTARPADRPADPTRENFIFKGWYSDEALTQAYDFNKTVDSDLTIYAKWAVSDTVEVNDTVFFGNYEQDNRSSNGKEPIEWIVLKKENGRALLLSKYALDCQQYNDNREDVTWEDCTLRKWLNTTFINDAFRSGEQSQIHLTYVSDPDQDRGYDSSGSRTENNTGEGITDPIPNVDGGNGTEDRIFLLSEDEALNLWGYEPQTLIDKKGKKYTGFPKLQAACTDYAAARGVDRSDIYVTPDGEDSCTWWLRSPAGIAVFDAGSVVLGCVDYSDFGVRPALWTDLES